MRPELQERFLRVAHRLERLDRLHAVVSNAQQTSPRALIASAAVASAEFLAAATGNEKDAGAIHRAYEEIFSALESSEAIREMLSGSTRLAELQNFRSESALAKLQSFRNQMLGGSDE